MSINEDGFECDGIIDRRSIERDFCGKSALLFFSGQAGVDACHVHDITAIGANIRLQRLNLLPLTFLFSFDKFANVRTCRLKWRDGDFVGLAFENQADEPSTDRAESIPALIRE
jgi:hypothetical protein